MGPASADPSRPTLDEAIERIEDEEAWAGDVTTRLQRLVEHDGDLTPFMDAQALSELGNRVVDDYEQDKADRKEWDEKARDALKAAKQIMKGEAKSYPWPNASNINYPILTEAALQFNARMYPAVVKGDEAVLCKVVGQDNGQPELGPDGQPLAIAPDGGPITATQAMQMPPEMQQQLQPVWKVPPGAKAKRARRVSEYLNNKIFYEIENWEGDTDTLLMQLPIVGCAFRKVWYDADLGCRAVLVSALNLYAPAGARDVKTTPRLTEAMPDIYPYEITQKIRSGFYREVDLAFDPKEGAKGRLLLEQHCLIDMDEDGLEEPYIVTVDHETREVLRIERNFADGDIRWKDDERPAAAVEGTVGMVEAEPMGAGMFDAEAAIRRRVVEIKRGRFYVKYGFIPDPDGGFYDLGLGHLLGQLGGVIDTALNQLMDAGTAQTAGGGFIGSGVRLQTRGNRGVIRMAPGEYKTVDVSGDNLRANIVDRTLPNVSPVTFQILDLVLGAAKGIAGAKDVITGEASNNGQVGTTLALIEQGLQVFNATAKRTFRAMKEEFQLVHDNVQKYGDAEDYRDVLDDSEADFEADFAENKDIRPVSDPAAITRMQKMARAQFIMGTIGVLGSVGGDPREALRRVYEAVDAEDIDKLLPPPKPQAQDPMQAAMAELQMKQMIARATKDMAGADQSSAKAAEILVSIEEQKYDLQRKAMKDGMALGAEAAPGPQTGADIGAAQ
jgi:chaperonin GroES